MRESTGKLGEETFENKREILRENNRGGRRVPRPYFRVNAKFPGHFCCVFFASPARFLWSDSSMVWTGKDSIMCDHYRMDINILDSTFSIKGNKDYFMKNIIDENYIRELWVKRKENREIIKARVKNNWITLIAIANY